MLGDRGGERKAEIIERIRGRGKLEGVHVKVES